MTENKSKLSTFETWLTGCEIAYADFESGGNYVTVQKLLIHILKGQHHMTIQLQALNDAASKLQADVAPLTAAINALTAAHTDTSAQTAIDAVTAAVTSVSTAVETLTKNINDVLNPAPVAKPAA